MAVETKEFEIEGRLKNLRIGAAGPAKTQTSHPNAMPGGAVLLQGKPEELTTAKTLRNQMEVNVPTHARIGEENAI